VSGLPVITVATPVEGKLVSILLDPGLLGRTYDLVFTHMRAEWRISENHIEPAFVETIYVEESVMVVNPTMTVSVHDHVHFAGASGSGLSIGRVDAVVSDVIEP
jgi:hypothetical protein